MHTTTAFIFEDEMNDKDTQESASVLQPVSLVVFAINASDLLPKEIQGTYQSEEGLLEEKFGQAFAAFKASTPRLLPNIKKYSSPDELPFQPHYFNKAMRDAIWWFAPVPFYELIHALHHAGIIKPLFSLF